MQKSEKSFVVNLLVCWSEWSWGAPHRLVRKQKCWKHHSEIREFLRVYTWCIHAIKVHTCLVVKAGQSQREIISASWCVKLLNETSILDSHVNFILLCDSSFFPLPYSLKSWWRPTPPLSTSLKWAKRPLFGVRNKNHGFMHSSRYDLLCLCVFCLSSGFHDMSKKKKSDTWKNPNLIKMWQMFVSTAFWLFTTANTKSFRGSHIMSPCTCPSMTDTDSSIFIKSTILQLEF